MMHRTFPYGQIGQRVANLVHFELVDNYLPRFEIMEMAIPQLLQIGPVPLSRSSERAFQTQRVLVTFPGSMSFNIFAENENAGSGLASARTSPSGVERGALGGKGDRATQFREKTGKSVYSVMDQIV